MTDPGRWMRLALAASVLVALGSLVLSLVFVTNQQRVERTANHAEDSAAAAIKANQRILAQRTEARITTCVKDKRFADAHNGLILYLASVPPDKNDTRSPAQRAALIRDFEMKNLVPTPDCSPEGIAAFYAGQGGTDQPAIPAGDTAPSTTTTKAKPRRTTTTTRPTTTTGHATTTTTVRSGSTTVPTPCTGVSLPGGLPCL